MTKKKTETLSDKVQNLIDERFSVVDAILTDHLVSDSCIDELRDADSGFENKLFKLLGENQEFDSLLEVMKESEVDTDKLIEMLDELDGQSALEAWAEKNGFVWVRVETLQQQEKLKSFVESEIWPNYNDRKNYNI